MSQSIFLFLFILSSFASAWSRAETHFDFSFSLTEAELEAYSAQGVPSWSEFSKPCDRPVDEKKVLLFVDNNSAYREVMVAREAACKLGIRFESLPGLEITYKTGVPLEEKYIARDRAKYYSNYCIKEPTKCDAVKKKELNDDFATKESEAAKVGKENAYIPGEHLRAKAQQFAQDGTKVVMMVVSGHHYEYAYYGDYLTPNRFNEDQSGPYGSDILPIARAYPQVFDQLKTAALWGCSSVTVKKIDEWKSYFPSIRLIGGYVNTAPSSIRPDNHQFLRSLIMKSDYLIHSKDSVSAKQRILSIDSVQNSYSGVYIKSQSGEESLFQVVPKTGTQYGPVLTKEACEPFLARLNGWVERLKLYESGTLAIPEDNEQSELKHIYFDLQTNAACYKNLPEHKLYNSPRVGLLRFFESGVKLNFALKFKSDFDQAATEMISSHYQTLNSGSKKKKHTETKQGFDINVKPALDLLRGSSIGDFITKNPRASILALHQALSQVKPSKASEHDIGTAKIEYITRAIGELLVKLRPECTEMLTWHEPRPDSLPSISCAF